MVVATFRASVTSRIVAIHFRVAIISMSGSSEWYEEYLARFVWLSEV